SEAITNARPEQASSGRDAVRPRRHERLVYSAVAFVSGAERADALCPVRVDARCLLLAVERGAIADEGQCALRPCTSRPPPVGAADVLAGLPPRQPAVDERVGECRALLRRH